MEGISTMKKLVVTIVSLTAAFIVGTVATGTEAAPAPAATPEPKVITNTVTETETVEVEVIPESCIAALDASDAIISISADVLEIVLEYIDLDYSNSYKMDRLADRADVQIDKFVTQSELCRSAENVI